MSIDPAAQFDVVRLLIKQNKFDRARTILEGMEGKKAQRWLAELNERHPPVKPAAVPVAEKRSPIEASPIVVPPKAKNSDISPEKSAAVGFWVLAALASLIATILKLFED